jgi:hypothetical protein
VKASVSTVAGPTRAPDERHEHAGRGATRLLTAAIAAARGPRRPRSRESSPAGVSWPPADTPASQKGERRARSLVPKMTALQRALYQWLAAYNLDRAHTGA